MNADSNSPALFSTTMDMWYRTQFVVRSKVSSTIRFFGRKLAFFLLCFLTALSIVSCAGITTGVQAVVTPSAQTATSDRGTSSSQKDGNLIAETVVTVLAAGQQQYESGHLVAALRSWRQAAEQPEASTLQRSLAWSYVAIAAQDLGDWEQAEHAIAHGLELLSSHPQSTDVKQVRAQVLNAQGRLQIKKGQPEAAWETWTQAESIYEEIDDSVGRVGAQINQAQALQTMGLYRRSHLLLQSIADRLSEQPDSHLKAAALKSLGDVVQVSGNLNQSRQYLEQSAQIFQQLGNEAETASALFSLANTLVLMDDVEAALHQYDALDTLVQDSALKTKVQLNHFAVFLKLQQWADARQILSVLMPQIQSLPPSRESIYAKVNLTERLLSSSGDDQDPMTWVSAAAISQLLRESAQQAQLLQDTRAESLVLGEMSKLYSYTKQWESSQQLAKRAIDLAETANALDIAYRWEHQLGRVYRAQGDGVRAIESYKAAVETLRQVRRDLLTTNEDVQFSFRETVEPIYRELVSLLLMPDEAEQSALNLAREMIEELQLAELENYFRSACVDTTTEYIDKLDSEAAVLYPIILPDRIEVVLSLPELPLQHYRAWQPEEKTNQIIGDLFEYLNPALSSTKRKALSEVVYSWLIEPAEPFLSERDIQTLVFVPDGRLRSIPMSALYDGQQYLVEKYSVALTPGLRLLGPHFQNPKPLQALMLGLTQARNGFSALPGVKQEIENIASQVNAKVLFDEEFTQQALQASINRLQFPVLHLATHGQFSSDLEKTFLLAWDERITLGELDDVLRSRRQQNQPIELMVLSACQTAEGDDRAALGLAGMAIRSGARSTLATLWSVNDSSTALLMSEFYKELEKGETTKAEALRRAQISVLKNAEFSHPFYWSPFVLIGNWLS